MSNHEELAVGTHGAVGGVVLDGAMAREEPLVFPEKYSRLIRRSQRRHALLVFVAPLAATVVSIVSLPWVGVSQLDLTLLAAFYFPTMLGGSVGFHRLLSHRSFETSRPIRATLLVLGCMTAQGTPLYWASNHRRHHQFSDREGDPHSPYHREGTPLGLLRGLWHSHTGWSFDHRVTNPYAYCRDLLADPVVMRINEQYLLWIAVGLALPALLGWLFGDTLTAGLTGLLWGGLVRICLTYHSTCSINSLAHAFGRRPFPTGDGSRNVAWLAIPTVGEAWHNNHHAFVASPVFGLRWWQVDLGGLLVVTLERAGLAWNIRRPTATMIVRASGRQRGAARGPK